MVPFRMREPVETESTSVVVCDSSGLRKNGEFLSMDTRWGGDFLVCLFFLVCFVFFGVGDSNIF